MHNYFPLESSVITQYEGILDVLRNTDTELISYRAFKSFFRVLFPVLSTRIQSIYFNALGYLYFIAWVFSGFFQ